MRNYSFKLVFVGALVSCMSCSLPLLAPEDINEKKFEISPSFKPPIINKKGPVALQYKPLKGHEETTHYNSKTVTRSSGANQIRRENEEVVDFTVKAEVKSVASHYTEVHIETLRKDGYTDLYDLGYPEAGETIEYEYAFDGNVKKAGHFPPNSLFFIPPLSLPKKPVEVGDTWAFKANWISLKNGLPMAIDLISIFKNMYKCGDQHECAEIEISGEVTLPPGLVKSAKLESRVFGRILYNVNTSTVIWSEIRNKEKLNSADDKVEIHSCIEAVLETPAGWRWPWRKVPGCDPFKDLSVNVPGI